MPKNTPEAIIDTPYVTSRRGTGTSTSGGVTTFLGLTDTPNSYAGAGEYLVKVKASEDGLEFILGSGGAVDSVNGMTGVVVLDTDDIAEGSNLYFTTERAQDAAGAALNNSSSVTLTYNDGANTITAAAVDEYLQDVAGAMWSGNTETGVTVTYQDSDGTLDIALDDEYVQDLIGTSITGGTQSGIAVTYTDASGVYNFVLDAELLAIAGLTSAADKIPYFTGSGMAALADFTSTARSLVDDTSTSAMRTTLGLVIGTNVQAFDATLTSIAGLGTAADKVAYTTGIDTWAETPLTSFGRSLIDDAAASNARTTLGLVIGTDVQAYDATLLSIAALGTAADKMAYTTGIDTWAETPLTSAARSILDDTTVGAIRTTLGVDDEGIQDVVGAMWVDSSIIDVTYNDVAGTISATLIAASVPNSALANSAVTIGSTAVSLGATAATVAGLTLTTPTIADFTNAAHDHGDADDGGVLVIGAISAVADARYGQLAAANVWTATQTVQASGAQAIHQVIGYRNASTGQTQFTLAGARGTSGTPLVSQANDIVGQLLAYGYSAAGGGFVQTAAIQFAIDGTPDSGGDTTDMPGRIVFSTTPDGSATLVEVLRISSAALVTITGDLTVSGAATIGGAAGAAQLDVLQATLGNVVQRLASTATNDDPTQDTIQNRIATTNATVTTLHAFTIPASTTYFVEATVIARRTGGTSGTADDGAAYVLRGVYQNVAGTATIIGAIIQTVIGESQAGWDATLDTTGATVRVRVTGAANNNVTWHMTARCYPVSS